MSDDNSDYDEDCLVIDEEPNEGGCIIIGNSILLGINLDSIEIVPQRNIIPTYLLSKHKNSSQNNHQKFSST